MNIHWVRACLLLVALCIASAAFTPNAARCDDPPKDSIAALFDGIPADLRSKVQSNSVRRDRVNDWLADQVNGKGKTIELQLPARVAAGRSKDGTYRIFYSLGQNNGKGFKTGPDGGGPVGSKVTVLDAEWSLHLKFGVNDPEKYWPNQLELAGVSAADAEKLVDVQKATIKARVQDAKLVGTASISLTLAEVQVDGKKLTPRKREPRKEAEQ